MVAAIAATSSVACSGSPKEVADPVRGPLAYRVIKSGRNAHPCVQAPAFSVAPTEEEWIDVFDMQTECRPEADFELPNVRFTREVAVAAWWRPASCAAGTVTVQSVERDGAQIVVTARTAAVEPCPADPGALESFIAVARSPLYDGTQPVRFVIDGTATGTATPSPTAPRP